MTKIGKIARQTVRLVKPQSGSDLEFDLDKSDIKLKLEQARDKLQGIEEEINGMMEHIAQLYRESDESGDESLNNEIYELEGEIARWQKKQETQERIVANYEKALGSKKRK